MLDLNSVTGLIFTRLMTASCISEVWPYLAFKDSELFLTRSPPTDSHQVLTNPADMPTCLPVIVCLCFYPLQKSKWLLFPHLVSQLDAAPAAAAAAQRLLPAWFCFLKGLSGGLGVHLSKDPDRYFTAQKTLLVFLGVDAFCQRSFLLFAPLSSLLLFVIVSPPPAPLSLPV